MTKRRLGQVVVDRASVQYGGVRAVDDVSLTVEAGSITGLIGPNGSGKTSTVNLISGLQAGTTAGLQLDGQELSGLAVHRRRAKGLTRTFQAIRVFESMSVLDNVLLGAHIRMSRGGYAPDILRLSGRRRQMREWRDAALELMALFGERLVPRIDDPAGSLSYANRRRVEVCRAVLVPPTHLLLDEPTAGMNPFETDEFADHLLALRERLGCSVLLVEHKMDFVQKLCDDVYVLDRGQVIAHGSAAAVVEDPTVVEAYLGA